MPSKREKTFELFENLDANIQYYIAQFNGVGEDVPGRNEILSKLKALKESSDNFGVKYLHDPNIKLSKDSYNQLLTGMSSLYSEINNFTSADIKGQIGPDNKSIGLQFMAKECGAVFSDTFENLANIKYDETKPLEDNIGASKKTIQVDLKEEKGFSGALNHWIPVKFTDKDGTVREGFFNKNVLGEGIRDAYDEEGKAIAPTVINYEVKPGYMNKRNELATELADDLKLDYVAKSESVFIEDSEGNMVEGTFMESANGSDIKHLDPKDPIFECKNVEACSDPKFLKQIADIQVYDYLMDNLDRSEANVIYNVAYNDQGKPYIASVKCIDNDSTYFSARNQGSQSYMAGPEDMRAISADMAMKVMSIDTENYKLKMASKGLTKLQIDAALERLETMKTQIKLSQTEPEKAAFKVLLDEDFAKYSIKDFNDPSKFNIKNVTGGLKDCSMYSRVYDIATAKVTWPEPKGKNVDYCEGTLKDSEPKLSKEALVEYKIDLLKSFNKLATPGDKKLTEYKVMEKGLSKAITAIDEALKNTVATGSDIIPNGDKNKINRALKGFSEATNSFMYKSGAFSVARDWYGMPVVDTKMSRYRDFAGMIKDVKGIAINYGKNNPELNMSRDAKKQEYYHGIYNRLKECRNAFKANEAWYVKSSDDYMNLRKAVKDCVEDPTWNKGRYSKEDMARLDKMFDRVKEMSKIYYDNKVVREVDKQTARGQNRMKAVEKLMGKEVVLENKDRIFKTAADKEQEAKLKNQIEQQVAEEHYHNKIKETCVDVESTEYFTQFASKEAKHSKFNYDMGLDLTRRAIDDISAAMMAEDGYAIADIFDPNKFADIKKEYGNKTIKLINDGNVKEIFNHITTGMEKLNSLVGEKMDTMKDLDFSTLGNPKYKSLYGAVSTLKGLYQNVNDLQKDSFVKEKYGPNGLASKQELAKLHEINTVADTYAHFYDAAKYANQMVEFAYGKDMHPAMLGKVLDKAIRLRECSDVAKQMVNAPENKGKSMKDMLLKNDAPTFYGSYFLLNIRNEADSDTMLDMQLSFSNKNKYEGARQLMKDFLNDKINLKIELSGKDIIEDSKIKGLKDIKNRINQYAEEYKLSKEPNVKKENEKNLQAGPQKQ